jgi:hypothetical protein
MNKEATFVHASEEGWATYHKRLRGWRRLVCAVKGHRMPTPPLPSERNGHSASNYGRCLRCRNAVKWYVPGQHRYGGLWQ